MATGPDNSSTKTPSAPDFDSEMRIGLAMSGGIALVLYQSGAAHEILRFVRSWDKEDSPAYHTLLKEARIKPVLDIITGASAGGINCVLLGHCLAFERGFDVFRKAWVEVADIQNLRYDSGESPHSLLNREPLLDAIREEMGVEQARTEIDIDLYTALCRTEVQGQEKHSADSLGHMISVDTRANFIEFDLDDYKQNNLAQLLASGSATSAFPAAFAVVEDVESPKENPDIKRWFIDGGLWNNQPLDLAVGAVQDKPAYSLTHRYLFLIQPEPISKPEPTNVSQERDSDPPKEPSLPEVLMGLPLMGLNGNIWDAVQNIQRYNQRYAVYKKLLGFIEPEVINALGAKLYNEAQSQLNDVENCDALSPLNLVRFHNVFFQNDSGLIARWEALFAQCDSKDKRHMNQFALECLNKINEADLKLRALRREVQAINERHKATYAQYRSRVNTDFINERGEKLEEQEREREHTHYYEAHKDLQATKQSLYDKITLYKSYLVGNKSHSFKQNTITLLTKEEATKAWQSREARVTLLQAWKDANLSFTPPQTDAVNESQEEETDQEQRRIEFHLDCFRYVFASISDLIGKSEINLIRISPEDTDNLGLISTPPPSITSTKAKLKLAGERLGHFAGFLEEHWRRNDYVWARLDSAEILLKTVWQTAHLDDKQSIAGKSQQEWLIIIQKEILSEELAALEMSHPGSDRKVIGYGEEALGDLPHEKCVDDVKYLLLTLLDILAGYTHIPVGFAKFAVHVGAGIDQIWHTHSD